MNRQLTIKEIAPYLNYELNMYCGKLMDTYLIYPILGLANNEFYTYVNGEDDSMGRIWMDIEQYKAKPILYPLSSLTNKDIQDEIMIRWGGGLSDKAKENWLKEVTDEMMYTAFNALRYDFVELMLEKHIDLFGLIPSGLAIDKTTL